MSILERAFLAGYTRLGSEHNHNSFADLADLHNQRFYNGQMKVFNYNRTWRLHRGSENVGNVIRRYGLCN